MHENQLKHVPMVIFTVAAFNDMMFKIFHQIANVLLQRNPEYYVWMIII